MKSRSLFLTRWIQDIKYQLSVYRLVIDWTVIIYATIPALAIFIYAYHSWWLEIPNWVQDVPMSGVFLLLFLFLWYGAFRTYVREADLVFLLRKPRLLLHLKRFGLGYSIVKQIVPASILALVLAPFWFKHFQWGFSQLISFVLLWTALRCFVLGVKGQLQQEKRFWKNRIYWLGLILATALLWVISYYCIFYGGFLLSIGLFIIFIAIAFYVIRKRFLTLHTLEQDLLIENHQRNKIVNTIFNLSFELEGMPKRTSSRKTPLLFRKSQRIFSNRTAEKGFHELFMKASLRERTYLYKYLQIIGWTNAAVILFPKWWIKILILVIGLFVLNVWLKEVWDKVIGSHPYTKKYNEEAAYRKARGQMIAVCYIPYVFFLLFGILFSLIF
ncbi:ABC transporter permease [Ornithinibacillus sp. 4-3]|uniref:ABC transporter permease n=1 Tax=Ornithinibacillus sp. 4-3 TaxID=3231488 RepID=A0AB39HRA9_9BACI